MTRLEELARRYGVPPGRIEALDAILALQAEDPTAPTTVTDPAQAVDRHVADSLVAVDQPAVRHARRIADLGSGAGWPGLALAAALPDARIALVESAIRHCRYLERAIAAGRLENAEVVHARAEEWVDGLGANDVVTARAVAALPVLCEYAAPLLADGGVLIAWKGAVGEDEAADGAAAAAVLGLELQKIVPVQPFPAAERRTLHLYLKVAPTPERFPRRAGMAVKRPLVRRSSR